jgi:anthranilate phosphoribosyltransferase
MNRASLLLAALALAVLTGCRDSTAELTATACTELSQLQQSLAALQALGPTATVEQVQDAADTVREDAQDAARAVRAVAEGRYQDLRDAQVQFWSTADNIPSSSTVAQAKASIQAQVAAVSAAREQLTASLGCT